MIALYILSAFLCIYILHKDRSHLPGVIVMAALFGAGPGLQGRFFLDEFLICISIAFVMLTSWRDFWRRFANLRTQLTWWDAPFLALCIYYTAQGLRTALTMNAPGVAAIGGINLYLAGIYLVLRMYDFPAYCQRVFSFTWKQRSWDKAFADLVVIAVIVFNVAYLAQGLFAEKILHVIYDTEPGALGRFANQGISWSGSAYALMPSLIGLFVGAWRFPEKYTQYFVFLGVLLVTGTAFDSRVALLLLGIGGFFVLWRLQLKMFKTGIPILLVAALLCVWVNPVAKVDIKRAVTSTVQSTTFLAKPTVDPVVHGNAGDYGRYLHFYAGFVAIKDSVGAALFGHGLMLHRVLVGPNALALLREDPDLRDYEDSIPMQRLKETITQTDLEMQKPEAERSILSTGARTTSFTAMLIDGGYTGLILFILTLACAFFQCARGLWYFNWRNHRLVLTGMAFVMVAAWPVIIFVADLTLYWVMVMPMAMAAMLPREAKA